MNSTILDNFGISDPGILIIILFVITVILLVLLIFLLVRYNQLNVSYQMFMKGKKAESLEEEIGALFNDISSLKTSTEKNRKDIKKIIENLSECYQRVGIVKYDAFKEMGGKLSFSVALLNDNETGFIINSIHSSEGCYVYTKEIVNGECAISLGDEEKKALTLALSAEPYVYD
ncbi:MAG: DUF4446 family protein [Lachnospiraceae bacterium]|jgi:hypothetical protein|nr:DUF4446 family protein [Lachnospiraceae bacterium]MBQ6320552.1 DUF4446 family protein [Lachnospiraceae bacterium]